MNGIIRELVEMVMKNPEKYLEKKKKKKVPFKPLEEKNQIPNQDKHHGIQS